MNLSFPSGLALGGDFCNRVEERALLKASIFNNEHVVMSSPRRYGKTSLINQVMRENEWPFVGIDLLPSANAQQVKAAILRGISQLLPQILPKQKVLMNKLLGFFKNFNPKISVSVLKVGFSVELHNAEPPSQSITEALMSLDQLAQEVQKRVVVLMDEFQQVSTLSDYHSIEASIRHAVERSKNVSYIFSGSERHILEQMFHDKSRPLYHLCKLMRIERIHQEDFARFIQDKAQLKWGQDLAEESLLAIFRFTECHTYYVNYLCRQLWRLRKPPVLTDVEAAWQECIQNQLIWITDDLAALSANQRAILLALVSEPTREIYGQSFLSKVNLQAASAKRAIESLAKRNFIFADETHAYHVLDPALATYLREARF